MIEIDGVQGELVPGFLVVYTTDRDVAYQFYVEWMRSQDLTPLSQNAVTMLRLTSRIDIILE